MGFHEDDRIRRKNVSYTREGITSSDICLRLNSVPVSDMVELLINNGYKVELKSDHTISINRKCIGEEKPHDNKLTNTI